ncbi:NifX-associated nitrogen fixation protein (plasmid) [Sinorhizobium garamanticum]|uniref:NifX-associated nitrogen fixation protein n=1 Tax=Sinorhizobium garamanticum TaxID=680247 RepID=A0ABY8DKL3_9HYPH|nr:NifX-associated nitrogen fixation protein [Sinorhizobium garamanticum]WEX91460.1 NifX-associated nitrogen fixation protein [Sinorhizobium garamanticum]
MTTLADPASIPAVDHGKLLSTPFIRCLVRLIRAQDSYGSWDGKCDAELLAKFIVKEEQRRAIPIIGDPDPDALWRLDVYYAAVGLSIEARSDLLVSRTMEISAEGFGRVVFTTKRLVVLSKTLRGVHRFGFDSLRKCEKTGTKLVKDAVAAIEAYPDVARA